MRLYSIQPLFVYEALCAEGVFHARPQEDPECWLNEADGQWRRAYDWLCEQMERRGLARPAADVYPVWAWRQWSGPSRPRPDLRTSSLKSWAAKERHVLLTLEVPDHAVLVSDYDAWHWCLNYWYLGSSRDCARFERECKRRNLSYFRDKPLPDAQLHTQLVDTWQGVLDLEGARRRIGVRRDRQVLQATFWTLRAEYVRQALEFGLGQAAVRLALPG